MYMAGLGRGNSAIKSPSSSESAGRTALGKREEFLAVAAVGSTACTQQGLWADALTFVSPTSACAFQRGEKKSCR